MRDKSNYYSEKGGEEAMGKWKILNVVGLVVGFAGTVISAIAASQKNDELVKKEVAKLFAKQINK